MDKNLTKKLKTLKTSFLMYEKTIKECREKLSEAMNDDGTKKFTQEEIEEKVNFIKKMQDDVKQQFLISGGNLNDLISEEHDVKDNKKNVKKTITPKSYKKEPTKDSNSTNEIYQSKSIVSENWDMENLSESFDVIPLPSKGECYEGNLSTIAVSYLTANDENMIVSPNLYRDGLILDYLLKAKIKNKDIDPDDLLEGDREAIILWLRATGYGTDYPITVTDKKTGINFDTVIDLTQIKHKPFTLKGDVNGHFDFQLPISKDQIKFRFLTHGDNKQIENIEKEEETNIKKERLQRIVEELNTFIENDNVLNKDEKMKIYDAKRNIDKWLNKIEVTNDLGYTHTLTNRLELSIVSINGNENRDFIANYVQNMNVRDALELRRYINDNEPGLDYAITVERPESLGGGSMPVFLSVDEYVFLNIT
jgi:hypothetical protein